MVGRFRATVNRFTVPSLQFVVLGFRLLQDWVIGVSVFPEREETFVPGCEDVIEMTSAG
jgi:hypothetical protein